MLDALMVDCCIILCGSTVRRKRQKKISPELQRVLDTKPLCYCSACNAIREPTVYRYNKWFTLYCIPCFRYKKGPEVLICPVCTGPLQIGSSSNLCSGCGRWNSQREGYCPSCGRPIRIQPVQMNT